MSDDAKRIRAQLLAIRYQFQARAKGKGSAQLGYDAWADAADELSKLIDWIDRESDDD